MGSTMSDATPVAQSEYLRILTERGFFQDCTDFEDLDAALCDEAPISAYIGFDCTAPSLHVGSLIQIMLLRWLQKSGHRPIVLMGGGTTKIGDPSGKDESRQLLTPKKIAQNMDGVRQIFSRYLTFDESPTGALMLNNAEWLDELNYVGFLRDYGRHFTINRMLTFDSVRLRLDRQQPLTFLEFNYMLLQAYDFLELSRRVNCRLQIGGSDQWGNIVNGVELGRRVDGRRLFGLTSPLLTVSDGKKMGKTADGAVWLNARMRSPYEFWQFWRNTADADVGRFLRLFTELDLSEIVALERLAGAAINAAKIRLANEVTTLAHGAAAASAAEKTAHETFEQGGAGADLPTVSLQKADIGDGLSVVQLFVKLGLCGSGKEAKRLIAEGGAKIDDVAISDQGAKIRAADLAVPLKLSAGKKRHAIVKLAQ